MDDRTSETKLFLTELGSHVSQQTVATYFLKLGEYIYSRVALPGIIKLVHEFNPVIMLSDEEIEEAVITRIKMNIKGELESGPPNHQRILYSGHDSLIKVLRKRLSKYKKIRNKTFRSHLGYATMMDLIEDPEEACKWLEARLAADPL